MNKRPRTEGQHPNALVPLAEPRLVGDGAESGAEGRMAGRLPELFRAARSEPGLSDARLDVVARRLFREPHPSVGGRQLALARALLVPILLIGAGGASAVGAAAMRNWLTGHASTKQPRETQPPGKRHRSDADRSAFAYPAPARPMTVADSLRGSESEAITRSRATLSGLPSVDPQGSTNHSLGRETPPKASRAHAPAAVSSQAHLIASALRALHQGRDPRSALSYLDENERLHPDGALAPEAFAARVEGLVMSNQTREALALLDARRSVAEDAALRVLRGELRAHLDRCSEALADFVAVPSLSPGAALAERALWGEAACLSRLGRSEEARERLSDYLSAFPSGGHSQQARMLNAQPK